ncbi:hypothetical protein CAPTEDRAFT_220349 [Capitella teleta]|uniref:carbonyl reductase (NADPH) n=2 Tax=Capitella teleta TaxID=283909 RepID=R7UYY9_CAPTE|nr:hypothetical protein CAPTEDRAFT_220349 [Capitella teleta]|eukprot:ELU11788.1 hypothetical protein CAPTEDRAFT_220349 [Capitella teleta]
MNKVAVVSGSNKGIGYAIVRGLCKQFNGDVILTSRDESRGREAVSSLEKEGLHPKFHQLDIEDASSIEQLKEHLVQNYGGLDVLVNNAGFAFKQAATEPFSEQAEVTVRINYLGTLAVMKAMMPILRSGARVANVSSLAGSYAFQKCSKPLQSKLQAADTIDAVTDLMTCFVQSAKNNTLETEGWPSSAYGTSKLGLCMLSSIIQKHFDADSTRSDIIINACCPGHVDTQMTDHMGSKTIDEGAETPLLLALLPPNVSEPRGQFMTEGKIEDWMKYEFNF